MRDYDLDECIRRLLVATASEVSDDLQWHYHDDELFFSMDCSDLFDWAAADNEPVETIDDVRLIERCRADLHAAGEYRGWYVSKLYAARKRRQKPTQEWFDQKRRRIACGDAPAYMQSVIDLFNAVSDEPAR